MIKIIKLTQLFFNINNIFLVSLLLISFIEFFYILKIKRLLSNNNINKLVYDEKIYQLRDKLKNNLINFFETQWFVFYNQKLLVYLDSKQIPTDDNIKELQFYFMDRFINSLDDKFKQDLLFYLFSNNEKKMFEYIDELFMIRLYNDFVSIKHPQIFINEEKTK